ncbi:hypothetical protein TpMuguga_01g00198 [Theileria parva strain Muguga]|uniref:Uncharacterized protein n=1 Tax=Theileria parva TaxID=5875 RepID=Q4N9B6_THEPA|nr:uncharacterized protein TpMuguga_01g00198 [Theileria parva strain Muguga]EAN33442.1 hypothetical protein TpMuguga_01g00198 [Theileria parva strain Muguga]|eukprot:XP_765725.1 hypothetical protein [Theileria parva strain Muguga]
MGSENPLEILENECVNNETKDKVDKKSPDLKDFISDDESVESDDSYDRKKVNRGSRGTKTDKFGRRIRYQVNKKVFGTKDLKSKLNASKKYELYQMRKKEYESDKNRSKGVPECVSQYQLSAIDRMALRREQILKKHSENFINDVKKSKDND